MMRSILFFAALGATACGTHYAFIPAPPAHVVPAYNRDAAYVSIPEKDPHGDLRVLSYGIEKLTSGDAEEPSSGDDVATLHLRVIVENTGPVPWTIDTREQRLDVDGAGAESPVFAVSDREGDGSIPPVIRLTFGRMRIVDLFYPLPKGADAMPAFRAITMVHTDEGDVTETTPFQRVEVGIFSPYMQNDIVADGDYDYLDEPFLNITGGVSTMRSRGHGWASLPPGSSARGNGHARGGGGRARSSGHRSSGSGGHGHGR